MIIVKETAGDTLQGAINGINVTYETSYDFYSNQGVNIYVNGRLKIREWDDGFSVVLPRTVVLNEPLLDGDSLEVEYQSGAPTGGGADGGCPSAPSIGILEPVTRPGEDIMWVEAAELEPDLYTDEGLDLGFNTDDLKPVIVMSEEG